MPYWDEPKYNDPDSIDGPDDVKLPSTMHHMQAKAELDLLVRAGALSDYEAQKVMTRWRAKGELSDEDMIDAAISILAENEILSKDEANGLREKAAV